MIFELNRLRRNNRIANIEVYFNKKKERGEGTL
jgi:hypothetical protein